MKRNDSENASETPSVGAPATICYLTDRVACTIVRVSPNGARVTVREDKAIRTDGNGMSESQSYTYERNPDGTEHVFHRQGDGSYQARGKSLHIGSRRSYHDYSY